VRRGLELTETFALHNARRRLQSRMEIAVCRIRVWQYTGLRLLVTRLHAKGIDELPAGHRRRRRQERDGGGGGVDEVASLSVPVCGL